MPKPYTSPDLLPLLRRGSRSLKGDGLFVIDDANIGPLESQAAALNQGRGRMERDWQQMPLGYRGMAVFEESLIAYDDIFEMVKEDEEKGLTNRALSAKLGEKPLNQSRSDLCWSFSPTMVMRHNCAASGFPIDLSPMGPACYITNFKNIGGFGGEFVEATEEYGITTIKERPLLNFDRRLDTPEVRAAAARRRTTEYFDLKSRGLSVKRKMQVSYTVLKKRGPFSTGHNRYAHQMSPWDIVIVKDKLCYYLWNSGYLRNASGITILSEELGAYDDAIVPTVQRLAA